jgi:hypothetical protein
LFRPQGLVTLSTVYSLRTPAGFVSPRRRSWDSPFGAFPSRKVFERLRSNEPTYRFTTRFYRRRGDGPARVTAVPGLQPSRESLATVACLARRPLDAPLGFALLGHPGESLARTFAQPPLTCLAKPETQRSQTSLHRRVSIGSHLASSARDVRRRNRIRQPF